MKPLILSGLAAFICVSPALSQQRVSSPETGPDRRVTFRLNAPSASSVVLTGEFMRGATNLSKGEDGIWSVTVGPIAPEIYHYNLSVDGLRIIDPGNPEVKTGSTAQTLSSVLEVRGDEPAFYDGRPVPHGEIRTHWYESKSLETLRRLTVYTPPGYDEEAGKRYPVLYLFHGANADETAWTRLGRVNLILDNLLAEGKVKPFIVVMPFGYGTPPGSPGGQNTARFGRDLLEDVIPYVEARYRVMGDRENRAIVGLSMGGGQALSIGLNHLDLFSHVAGFSSGLGRAADWPNTYAGLVANAEAANEKLRLLWVGCGRDDGAFQGSKSFSEFLSGRNVRHVFRETEGAHTWIVWRRHLLEVAPLLFQEDAGAGVGRFSERSGFASLFNGRNLEGWEGNTSAWSVRDGAITGDTQRGGFLLYTKNDYDHFRLVMRSRLVSESNHLGVGFWGRREANFGYGGCILVIPPDGGMWDYIVNRTPPREKIAPDPPFSPHAWHDVEILANLATGDVQVAVNGFQTTRYRDVDPARLRKGPIGLQLHGGASVVQYKDIYVEENPAENRLLTLKP